MPHDSYRRTAEKEEEEDVDDLELLAERSLTTSGSEDESESTGSRDESEDDVPEEITEEHYEAIRSTVIDIVTALGGLEEIVDENGNVEMVYSIGDECLRCLRDLRTLLHQDEDDASRVIPTIFSEVNVLQRGLLPLLLKAADMNEKGSKIALACTDLITSLTWPIDIVAEQQAAINRDDGASPLQSYDRMQHAFVSYKAAILRSRSGETNGNKKSVLETIMVHILLPALIKPRHLRTDRDTGTISMSLHLFRNLLAIRDPVATSLSAQETIALSNLQNDLLVEMKRAHVLETILMLASNAETRDFEAWNVITADCVYHIYAGVLPIQLLNVTYGKGADVPTALAATPQNSALLDSLAAESRQKSHEVLSSGTSRHSRYGTTINFKDTEGALRIARTQRALRKTSEELSLQRKDKRKRRFRRKKGLDETGAARLRTCWTPEAGKVVASWAQDFVKLGFETLIRSIVKDIRSESFKAGNIAQSRTRMMHISHFFLEYFLLCKAAAAASADGSTLSSSTGSDQQNNGESVEPCPITEWHFDLVSYWLEPWALKMAWMRANTARDDRTWLEFVTSVQLWTTLLRLVDALGRSNSQNDRNMAEGIQAMHFYDELALDAAQCVMKCYTNQSFRCLETVIDFANIMPRTLERYAKDKENLFVKAKKQVRRSNKEGDEQALSVQEEQEQVRQMVESQSKERRFEFEKFQSHLCSNQLVDACLTYLSRWREITECVKDHLVGVLHILHRLAVKSGNLRLFFPYERRMMLNRIRDDQAFWLFLRYQAPKVSEDMGKLLRYVLSKFDKLDTEEKMHWAEGMKGPKPVKVFKMPAEIEIKPSRGRVEDIQIAVGLLLETEMTHALSWIKSSLEEVLREREKIVEEEFTKSYGTTNENDDADPHATFDKALKRFTNTKLPYHDDSRMREDASTRPEVKLLCRLLDWRSIEDDDHHWVWYIPADQIPADLSMDVGLLEGAIRTPMVSDEAFSTMVSRKRKVSHPRRRVVVNEFGDEEEVAVPRTRGTRKNPRQNAWLDDDLIEDSDEEIEQASRLLAMQAEHDEQQRQSSSSEISPMRSASSDHASRSSSATASFVHDDGSPQSKQFKQRKQRDATVKRVAARASKGLFLGDDDDSEGDQDDDTATSARPGSSSSPQAHSMSTAHKRRFHLTRDETDEEDDHGADADNDMAKEPQLDVAPQVRKRRALIVDEDEDE